MVTAPSTGRRARARECDEHRGLWSVLVRIGVRTLAVPDGGNRTVDEGFASRFYRVDLARDFQSREQVLRSDRSSGGLPTTQAHPPFVHRRGQSGCTLCVAPSPQPMIGGVYTKRTDTANSDSRSGDIASETTGTLGRRNKWTHHGIRDASGERTSVDDDAVGRSWLDLHCESVWKQDQNPHRD